MRDVAYTQSVAFSRGEWLRTPRAGGSPTAVPYLFVSDSRKKISFLKAGGFELYWQKLKLAFVQPRREDRAQVRPWVRAGCSTGLALVSGKGGSRHCRREGASVDRLQRNCCCCLYLVIQVSFGCNRKFPWKFTNRTSLLPLSLPPQNSNLNEELLLKCS